MALTRITKGVIKPNENYDTHNINSTGIVTAIGLDVNGNGDISGNLSVGGVLTYEDVTSIDSVGIITTQSDIHVGGGVSAVGVGTFGSLDISGDIDVDGHTNLDNVSIAGVVTATTIKSSNLTANRVVFTTTGGQLEASGNLTYNGTTFASGSPLDINSDLDVDGHTNLDNVSVAGISTFSGIVDAVNTPASIRVAQDIQHKGDANTKISFPANDEISFDTSGHDRIYIKSDGKIGIGTDDPKLLLHLHQENSNATFAHFTNTTTGINANQGVSFGLDSDENAVIYHYGSKAIRFATDGDERLRITSNGRVGVNTTNPQTTLYSMNEIAAGDGNRRFIGMQTKVVNGTAVGEIRTTYYSGANGNYPEMRFVTHDTERLRIDSSGNLDITTGQLTISNDIKSSDDDFYVYSYKGGSDGQVRSGIQYDGNSQRLRFFTGTNERLRIDSNGNVSLMTSTQDSYTGFLANSNAINLTLGSTAGAEPRIYLFGSGNGQSTAKDISLLTGSGTGDVRIDASKTTIKSTSNGEILRIETSAGNPGNTQGLSYMGFDHFYGSTKPAILIGSEEDGDASYKGNFVVKLKDSAATDDDPVERLRINSNGSVGINTVSSDDPNNPGLHIHGSAGDNCRISFSTPTKSNPGSRIGYYGLSNRFGIDVYNGFEIRDVAASYATRFRIDNTGRISAGKHGLGSYNDASEYFKIQSNDTSAVLSIIGSNDTHSTLALGDEDDFNRTRIRADHTHDLLGFWTADNERLRLTDKGVLSSFLNTSGGQNTGNAYYHRPVLEITHNAGTPPTQVKIITNIPWSGDSTHAHSVTIRGFRYGGRDTVDIQICWHTYANQFYNRVATSSGSYAPTITLAVENNKVVIHLTNPGYWPKFYVESLYHPYGSKEQAEGWSWSDNAISGDSGLPVNTVPYKWDAGGLSFNDDHNNNGQGDLTIADGNLVLASGHGINFSNAGGSNAGSSSATLDDYEEGSFTAILRSNSSPSNTNYTYDTSNNFTSYYTRIGNIVYVNIQLNDLHTSPDLRNHQLIRVEGLPFNAARRSGISVVDGRGIYPRWNNDSQTTNAATFTPWIGGGDNKVYMQLFMHYTPYTAWATVANSTSSQRLHLAGCYPVA